MFSVNAQPSAEACRGESEIAPKLRPFVWLLVF